MLGREARACNAQSFRLARLNLSDKPLSSVFSRHDFQIRISASSTLRLIPRKAFSPFPSSYEANIALLRSAVQLEAGFLPFLSRCLNIFFPVYFNYLSLLPVFDSLAS